ncbi:type I-E CRISPR-associated protein Cse1/CasA [Streptococcus sobrinus]|uniref:CRISPR system CASCADE complex protein CasA n=1 Tax=Streptococcus sobrinus W1703 TaxID=1227275 RepID=U2KM24_9STRE|nr:type I-E CRISPR-associated protein Cse1/CasA [Streptococcus sobrinus]AWN61441.1 type I-E CRISPR-associated protein Cse1/CasA [Streptococcus sobrinus]AWN63314.1 type I-E CRISPR-associated protein Cse1/CasA [Streptococcus sobrinus]ERJ75893.1 CRISPR system CASCADE complex protein CasA [Streptococcus sobrinus W1703]SQG19736.1 CRISPR system CASCADE complex protein CasA [Streptococcus sobrinus]
MSRFNLLDEPWLSVVVDDKGSTKEVSLLDLFINAHQYKDLAGDTKTQDFAVLRVLLAVLHTVFSRFDADGNPYDYLEIDERFRQIEEVEEDDIDKYEEDLYDTWTNLWEQGKFPEIISQYLEKWRDRFYLFDDDYPFFQVKMKVLQKKFDLSNKLGELTGKTMNRLISESGNKAALFSPRADLDNNKEKLSEPEIVRWLLTYHSSTEVGGRLKSLGSTTSSGWLFRKGGIYFKGTNLFETLLMNCILPYKEYNNLKHTQKPCWEYEYLEIIQNYFDEVEPDNIASLYTTWSKGVDIDAKLNLPYFKCNIIKLPSINCEDYFLEPMTLWKYQDKIGKFIPKEHTINQSLWRSFGLLTENSSGKNYRTPGVINWFREIKNEIAKDKLVSICAVGVEMKSDANHTISDEITDYLFINEFVLADLEEGGWIPRINDTVEETKKVISRTYKRYIDDIKEIRKARSDLFTSQKVEELYFKIDQPFRQWLASLQPNDEKDTRVLEWREILDELVREEAELTLHSGGPRDYIGIVKRDPNKDSSEFINIATAYNKFNYCLNQNLK